MLLWLEIWNVGLSCLVLSQGKVIDATCDIFLGLLRLVGKKKNLKVAVSEFKLAQEGAGILALQAKLLPAMPARLES